MILKGNPERDPVDELLVRHQARRRKAVRAAAVTARRHSQVLCQWARDWRRSAGFPRPGDTRTPK